MKTSFYIKSHNNNCYHFDTRTGLFALISPVLFEIGIRNGLNDNKDKENIISKYGKNIVNYYLKYYSWLEEACSKNYDIRINERLTTTMIEYAISNMQQITFEVTDACNLNCKYCGYGNFYENYDERKDKFLNLQTIKTLVNFLLPYWNGRLSYSHNQPLYVSFYGGEPLLNINLIKSVVELFEHLECKRRFVFSMTTNGILLKKHIKYLINKDFHLIISLDGNRKSNSYRIDKYGNESFENVYNVAKFIYKEYPNFFNKNVNFNSVFHNRSDIKNILSFFNLEFHKSPTISNLNTNGIRPKKENEFRLIFKDLQDDINNNKLHIEKDLFFSSPDASDITIFTHKFNNNVLNNYNDFYKRNHTIYKIPTGTCIPFSKKMFLTVNGKILPCERIGQESCLGFVNKENVEIDFKKICYKYNKLTRWRN